MHFAEHNFGFFAHIFFVIVLLEPESKTLFIVLFLSLFLQIFIFYFGIYRVFIFFEGGGGGGGGGAWNAHQNNALFQF